MSKQINKVTSAGLLIALGIIYGDIGTSPLYVFDEIIHDRMITELLVVGSLSCIIWTLTLQTTIKYVILTLQADNRGEGGISEKNNRGNGAVPGGSRQEILRAEVQPRRAGGGHQP